MTPGTPADAVWSAVLSQSPLDRGPETMLNKSESDHHVSRSSWSSRCVGRAARRGNWTNPPWMFEMMALDEPLAGASFGVWVETTTPGTRVHSVDADSFFLCLR